MSVSPFLYQTCTIKRSVGARDADDSPVYTETTIVTNLPCRFDKTSGSRSGDMHGKVVDGVLFIDAGLKDDAGATLAIQKADEVDLEGERYEILGVEGVAGMSGIHHYEIDLINYENK